MIGFCAKTTTSERTRELEHVPFCPKVQIAMSTTAPAFTPIGVARPAAPFLLGFDCLATKTAAMLADAKARGLSWCGCYLETLKAPERDLIFSYELAIALLTEADTFDVLTASIGTAKGLLAAGLARDLGAPLGVHVTIDFEKPKAGSDPAGYLNAKSDSLESGGYPACLYAGLPEPLSSSALYNTHPRRYWKGGGAVPEPQCGWCVVQLEPLQGLTLGGVPVDMDVMKQDYAGRVLTLWYPG